MKLHLDTALLAALLALAPLGGCATGQRMVRAVPFLGEDDSLDTERVNVWPLYYQSEDLVVVLWPLFDLDEQGFALRPLVAREDSEWSVLFPLAGWDAEDGHWWVLPAYDLEDNRGLLPLWNFGEWNHVGLVWWLRDDEGRLTGWGLAPLFGTGELAHVGPVWWAPAREGAAGSRGFFPLARFGERSGYLVPAWWSQDEQGELERLGVLPLFYYTRDEDYRRLITPLGGRSWGGASERGFVNVLGPVFHHSTDGERSYTALAWPIFALERDGSTSEARVFPLFHYEGGPQASSFSMLAGLLARSRAGDQRSLRLAPLFSYNRGRPTSLWDFLTLYGYRAGTPAADSQAPDAGPPDVSMHIGTPLVFNYSRSGDRTEWGSLLNLIDYESEGEESEFSLLYYLYRRQRRGEQVRRDLFPFITWDSGPQRSGFSFLWRLLHWERENGETRGHVLFLPWGG